MDVTVTELEDGRRTLELCDPPALYRIGLTEHGLYDIEFALAQRRAMSRRCPEKDGEHTCGLPPGHGGAWHLCRACNRTWQMTA
jgi:hypothetical protein